MDHNRCHWLISLEVDFLFICRPHLCLIADHIVFILSNTVNNDIFCKIFALTNRCNPQALILVDIYFKTAILRGTIIHFVVAKTTSSYTEVDSTVAFCPFKKFKCLLVARSAICTEFICISLNRECFLCSKIQRDNRIRIWAQSAVLHHRNIGAVLFYTTAAI